MRRPVLASCLLAALASSCGLIVGYDGYGRTGGSSGGAGGTSSGGASGSTGGATPGTGGAGGSGTGAASACKYRADECMGKNCTTTGAGASCLDCGAGTTCDGPAECKTGVCTTASPPAAFGHPIVLTAETSAEVVAVASTPLGIYAAGNFQGTTLAVSGIPGCNEAQGTGDSSDVFLLHVTPTSCSLKAFTDGSGSADQTATSMAVDPKTGDVWIGGKFDGSFGGKTSQFGDGFVIKLPASGASSMKVFTDAMGHTDSQTVSALVADPNGNVYVAGSYVESVQFPGTKVFADGLNYAPAAFVTKLNPDMTVDWAVIQGEGNDEQSITGLALDGSGHLIVVGTAERNTTIHFERVEDAGRTPLGDLAGSTYGQDAYVAWMAVSDGSVVKDAGVPRITHINPNYSGTAPFASAESVVSDAQGNVYLTGQCNGPGVLVSCLNQDATHNSAFVLELDPNGAIVGSGVYQKSGTVADAVSIALDGLGNPIVGGKFEGTLSIQLKMLASAQTDQMFLVKLQPNLDSLWSGAPDDSGKMTPASVAAAYNGTIVVGGS